MPIGQASPSVASTASPGPQNPNQPAIPTAGGQPNYLTMFGVDETDKNLLIDTITNLRSGWMQDRMERIRLWMLSVMMEKGIQWVGWDQSTNTWFDALAEFRNNGLVEDGETVELERWMNNITLMFKQIFVGNLTRAVPRSVVRPANAEKPKDVQTAKAAQDVIEIFDRKNKVRRMMRTIYETLFTFGVYFRHTRPTLDGVENGYDIEDYFVDMQVQMPARMKCPICSTETPVSDLPQTDPGQLTPCPTCGTQMGQESYYGEGEGNRMSLAQGGQKKIPRAGVKQSIHTPLEIDLDPNAKEWSMSVLLSKDQEIAFGEALKLFPGFRDWIQAGADVETSPNAQWEKLMRTQQKSVTSGYASDLNQSRPTYSENWIQPAGYWTLNKPDFAQRMEEKFPEGVKVTMLGGCCVDIRPAIMRREWSSCRLYENYGPFCPSIAERVVPFNQRFNAAMQMLDDWTQRASTGLNVCDASRLDPQKVNKLPLVPAHITGIPIRVNGEPRPLAEAFMHFDLPLNPAVWNYPSMLLTFCQLIAGLPPQTSGGGTLPGVDTATGQEQMLGQATEALQPYWENVKDECADAAYNEIYWVKQLMQVGALRKVWRSEEARGAGYRNQTVSWDQMEGEIEVFSDEDQGLPTSPDELRQSFQLMFKELTSGNPAAQQWFAVPANADMVLNTMLPGSVSPVEAQITKTTVDLQILISQPSSWSIGPDGQSVEKLPVEPDKNFEEYDVAKACVRNFALEQSDLRFSNPLGWQRLNDYYDMLEDADAAVAAARAARQLKVTQAGAPPPPQPPQPPPEAMAAVMEILRKAVQEVDTLANISQQPPLPKGSSLTAQVTAAKEVVDSAIAAGKEMRLAMQGGGK